MPLVLVDEFVEEKKKIKEYLAARDFVSFASCVRKIRERAQKNDLKSTILLPQDHYSHNPPIVVDVLEPLLVRAEDGEDMELFEAILQAVSKEEGEKITRGWKLLDISSYHEKLFQKFGMNDRFYDEVRVTINDRPRREIVTNAPLVYQAVLTGQVKVLNFYLRIYEQEHQGAGIEKESIADSMGLSVEPFRSFGRADPSCRHEGGYYFGDPDMDDSSFFGDCCDMNHGYIAFYDLLTAAILSQSIEMIEYVSRRWGEFRMSECMERSIVHSSPEVTRFLRRKYPELLPLIRLSAIIEGKNVALLCAYRDRYGRNDEKEAEAEQSLIGKNRLFLPYEQDTCWWTDYDPDIGAEFYCNLLYTLLSDTLQSARATT